MCVGDTFSYGPVIQVLPLLPCLSRTPKEPLVSLQWLLCIVDWHNRSHFTKRRDPSPPRARLLAAMPSHCWHRFPAFLVERMASECYLLCLWRQLASNHVAVCVRPQLETRDSSRLSPPCSLCPPLLGLQHDCLSRQKAV